MWGLRRGPPHPMTALRLLLPPGAASRVPRAAASEGLAPPSPRLPVAPSPLTEGGEDGDMTGLLHEREFSRKSFLKGGGALIVGFSLAGAAGKAATAADSPFASNGPYDQFQVDSWITINADN